MKKVIALIAAALFIIRFLVFQCFALPAPAPFTPNITISTGGDISSTSILGEFLVGSGVSSDLIQNSDGSYNKEIVEQMVQEYLSTGKIPDTFTTDDGRELSMGEYMQYLYVKDLEEDRNYWLDVFNGSWGMNFYDFVHRNEQNILPTPTVDMQGYGSLHVNIYSSGVQDMWFCDYLIIGDGFITYKAPIKVWKVYPDGNIVESTRKSDFIWFCDLDYVLSHDKFYGDVRFADGTQASIDDEYEYQVGELPGRYKSNG